jgi:dTDP-glucose 4,6-dehydratase
MGVDQMKLLVTGGCGFIGSNFIRYILEKYPDYKIINLDKLTYAGNPNNVKDVEKKFKDRYKFVKGDICNKKIVEKLISNVDVIVNFAAETHVDRSIIDAGSFVLTDIFGTYVLLEACRKFNKKFVQISTDEVYGSIEKGSFKETDKLEPRNPYSASKAGAELLARSYFITHEVPVIITRSSNNYGPYQYPEKIIPLFITNLIRGKKVPVYGDGKNIRDWLYVIDNCKAIDIVLHEGKSGEIYNIGGECEKTNIELTKMILKFMGKDESYIEYVPDRKGHDKRYSLDNTKIRKLGWRPETKFEDGLKQTVEWYKNNEWWWKPLVY